jgi:hypothetical protein
MKGGMKEREIIDHNARAVQIKLMMVVEWNEKEKKGKSPNSKKFLMWLME